MKKWLDLVLESSRKRGTCPCFHSPELSIIVILSNKIAEHAYLPGWQLTNEPQFQEG